MSETPREEQAQSSEQTSQQAAPAGETSWQEVGRQFQALGESLAQAMRAAWSNESTQRQMHEMRTGLESMARDITQAVEDSANSPQGQRLRQDAGQAVETIRVAGAQTMQEARPHVLSALQQLNNELQKLINRMEKKTSASSETTAPAEPVSNEPPSGSPPPIPF